MIPMQNFRNLKLMILGIGIAAIGTAYTSSVLASHNFEAGVIGNNITDNTHIRLDGLTLPPGAVMPVYDASPNFVSGHFLLRAPCAPVEEGDDTFRPTITVIAGHVDEAVGGTHMEKMPLYYIAHVSNPNGEPGVNSCIWHAHVPDPLNGGSPRVTDMDLINNTDGPITFNPGDVIDINIQRSLGSMVDSPYTETVVDIGGFNPTFDLNDADPSNDGLGFHHGGEE